MRELDPAARTLLEDLVDDWCVEGWIFSGYLRAMRESAAEPDLEAVRLAAVDLADTLLREGLIVAGGLATGSFIAWDVPADDMADRVRQAWLAEEEPDVSFGSVAWFDITPKGEQWLAEQTESGAEG